MFPNTTMFLIVGCAVAIGCRNESNSNLKNSPQISEHVANSTEDEPTTLIVDVHTHNKGVRVKVGNDEQFIPLGEFGDKVISRIEEKYEDDTFSRVVLRIDTKRAGAGLEQLIQWVGPWANQKEIEFEIESFPSDWDPDFDQ